MNSDFLVSFPGLGINDLPVNREAFSVFGQSIYWYGLLIALAIITCLLLASREAKKFGLSADDIMDTFILLIPMIIIFARIYYVIFEWEYYAVDLKRIFNTRHGGLAFYGGVIGGVVAILLVAKYKKISKAKLVDYLVVYLPLGQAIGRWGNFFNQEAFGSNTTMPWGMYSNETARYLRALGEGFDPSLPVHPTFLYEFIGNIIIFIILLNLRKKVKLPLIMTFSYLGMYGFIRFFVEAIRTDALYIAGTDLRISMILSGLMVVASVAYIIFAVRKKEQLLIKAALKADDTEEEFTQLTDEDDFIAIDEDDQNKDDFVPVSDNTDDFVAVDEDQEKQE